MNAPLYLLASLKLTLASLLLLLACVVFAYRFADLSEQPDWALWLLAPPLVLLSLNLIAAILTNPSFRAQPPLLVFHLCLLVVVALVGIGQLVNLKGWTEVTTGAVYDGRVNDPRAGLFHPWHIRQLSFVNEGFEIDYAPGPSRRHTSNMIRWIDAQGGEQRAVVGDQVPLQLEGYRFYTSFNKGFAPRFLWRDSNQRVFNGAVNLPAWPEHQFNQALEWVPPGSGQSVWVLLEFDDPILLVDQPSRFRLPKEYRLVIRIDQQRIELQPGDG